MAQYYPAPLPVYYAVPAVPVVWYVPTRARPNPSTHSPAAHRKRHPSNSTPPDAHSPWKRLQQTPPGSSYAHAPWPTGVPPTPELRTVPLPWVTTARANADQPRDRYPPPPPHRRSAANQTQAPPPSPSAAAAPAPPLVDPFLAVPHHPNTRPPIVWDMALHPSHAVLAHPSLTHGALRRRCAVRADGPLGRQPRRPLRALVLVFPLLPAVEIGIVPSPGAEPYVSLWDVLEGLHNALRAPIPPQELLRALGSGEHAALRAAAEARVPAAERAHTHTRTRTLRRIDYLAGRRWFGGVRPALGYELPEGRERGEVFVVEVGTGPGAGAGMGTGAG